MRRGPATFEAKITAPTLGLVTRIPQNQPDVRAAAVASNVRFDLGVARNAPGYGKAVMNPPLSTQPTFLFQGRVQGSGGTPVEPAIVGTTDKIWSILRLPLGYVPPIVGLNTLGTGGSNFIDSSNPFDVTFTYPGDGGEIFFTLAAVLPDTPLTVTAIELSSGLSWSTSSGLDPSMLPFVMCSEPYLNRFIGLTLIVANSDPKQITITYDGTDSPYVATIAFEV